MELTEGERSVLIAGLNEWGGPANPTDALAVAMGFDGIAGFDADRARLRAALNLGEPLSKADWQRVLTATEFVFVSDRFGSGVEWPTTTGWGDTETITLLRSLQRKFLHWAAAGRE